MDVLHNIFIGSWVADTLRLYANSLKYRYVDEICKIQSLQILNLSFQYVKIVNNSYILWLYKKMKVALI